MSNEQNIGDPEGEMAPAPSVKQRTRKAPSMTTRLRVFRRDGWLCRYCGAPVIFAPAMKVLQSFAQGVVPSQVAYFDPNWRRDKAPLLDHLGAVIDHVTAFALDGLDDESNFVTACNKCNIRKGQLSTEEFEKRYPIRKAKGKHGEPETWDGLSTVFVVVVGQNPEAFGADDRKWLAALTTVVPTEAAR